MPGVRIILFVRDVAAMTRFYQQVLEIAVAPAISDFVCLDAGEFELALHAIPAHILADIDAAKSPDDPPSPRAGAAIKPAFRVPDLQSRHQILCAQGISLAPLVTWEGAQYCDGIDPEGNVFQLFADAK